MPVTGTTKRTGTNWWQFLSPEERVAFIARVAETSLRTWQSHDAAWRERHRENCRQAALKREAAKRQTRAEATR